MGRNPAIGESVDEPVGESVGGSVGAADGNPRESIWRICRVGSCLSVGEPVGKLSDQQLVGPKGHQLVRL